MILQRVNSISISKTGNTIDDVPWHEVETIIENTFKGTNFTVNVCSAEIKYPEKEEQLKIITEYHESVVGGHQGMARLFNRIRENFYWVGMRKQINDFVRSCPICQKTKLTRIKTVQPLKITDTPQYFLDKVQMDIVGPMPITNKGNRYLLTLQDNLTKYVEAIPLPCIDAVTVALALAENFICRYGCPKSVHTDLGSNFTSKVMKTFSEIFKIKQIRSTAYHPESLGSLERSHATLVEYLKIYCDKRDWDEWMRYCIFSYNTSKHQSTGFTPHELVFGTKARIPSEFTNEKIEKTFIDYLDSLLTKLVTTQATAAENLEKAKQKNKDYYDQKLNPVNFKVNDLVILQKEPKHGKLDDDGLGPFEITRIFDDLNAEIKLTPTTFKIVHTNKLKLVSNRPNSKPDKNTT